MISITDEKYVGELRIFGIVVMSGIEVLSTDECWKWGMKIPKWLRFVCTLHWMIEATVNQYPFEPPERIRKSAEQVGAWYKERCLSRWTLGPCADVDHYAALRETARLVTRHRDSPSLDQWHPELAQHIDELDFLIR